METITKVEKGHWFNVVVFFLILKAAFSLYSIVTFYDDARIESFLSGSTKSVTIGYYSFSTFLLTIAPLVLAYLLYKRWFYKLCFVLAIIVCLGPPWGTALGVFTIILLRRETIKREFEAPRT
jgi:hypothetical protein